MDLKGKVAIVTGSSSDGGIGAECAKVLASRGCNIVVNYATNRAGAEKVAADCAAAGVKAAQEQGAWHRTASICGPASPMRRTTASR